MMQKRKSTSRMTVVSALKMKRTELFVVDATNTWLYINRQMMIMFQARSIVARHSIFVLT